MLLVENALVYNRRISGWLEKSRIIVWFDRVVGAGAAAAATATAVAVVAAGGRVADEQIVAAGRRLEEVILAILHKVAAIVVVVVVVAAAVKSLIRMVEVGAGVALLLGGSGGCVSDGRIRLSGRARHHQAGDDLVTDACARWLLLLLECSSVAVDARVVVVVEVWQVVVVRDVDPGGWQ